MDVGQGAATALYQQAVAGTFRMERGAAERCAAVYRRLVDTCVDQQIAEVTRIYRLEGFGGFSSSAQLQSGFENKHALMIQALSGLKEAALRMAAAYLQAGGAFDEADEMNRRAIDAAGEVQQ